MKSFTSLTDDLVGFGELEIRLWRVEGGHDNFFDFAERRDVLFMQKGRSMVEAYGRLASIAGNVRNMLEVGVLHGASSAFFHQLFQPSRLVCVDLFGPKPVLEGYKNRYAPDVIKPHLGIDQSDTKRMQQIIESEFSDAIDIVVDDASHLYQPTKATFNVAFPKLRHNGLYVIEDWEHWGDLASRPALVDFICELVVELGFGRDVIRDIGFGPCMAWIRRGCAEIPEGWPN
ncbi:MAG TPA: class I SAM-dependent methyltransferase [Candidatus Baltobacteraceae bacterium]|jgi:hypothetical protein